MRLEWYLLGAVAAALWFRFLTGEGRVVDEVAAVRWLDAAAELGSVDAQCTPAAMLWDRAPPPPPLLW